MNWRVRPAILLHDLASLHALGLTAFFSGAQREALPLLERATAILSETGEARIDQTDQRAFVNAPLYLGWSALYAG